ncbi:MAG: polysaccharide deacetylase family protein [Sedimentisphaerales bacterium]
MFLLTALVVLIIIFLYAGVPYILSIVAKFLLARKVIKSKAIVLTFDDGPGTKLTPLILNILAEYNVKATFFLLGRNISGREEIVRQIAAAGHEICSHGYDHLNYLKVLPFHALADIKRGWQSIDSALGSNKGVYPFRPPFGRLNLVCLFYLWIRKVPIFYWTFDFGDAFSTSRPDVESINARLMGSGGAVVLLHDFDRTNENKSNMVLELGRTTLMQAKENGMNVLTMSQFLEENK